MVIRSNVAENLFLMWLLVLGVLFVTSFEVEAQGHTTERLPKVLVVTSTEEPQYAMARHLWTDLFEYGIIANVSSASTYSSMDRSNYDVIIFSGYSNPVDPEDMYLNMLIDIDASRKLIFMNYYPFMQTSSDGTPLKTYYKLGIVDMPEDFPSGKFHKPRELSLVGNPGDSYLKDEDPSISNAYFFSTLPVSAIGWVKDETSNRYFAIFTDKGGWIGERSCTTLHMGKVVAKIWWGKTGRSFGFSMNVMYGKQVFLWRVDADKSEKKAPLNWLGDLATQHSLKFSIGARGERIASDAIAGYWRNLATNELAKIGVHTFSHQSPISAQNITHEVIDTYELMLSYDIPTEKFFLGWGTSDWSWQQIKTLYDYGWTIIHSSREDKFVPDTYNINTIANFTVAPALLGLTGRCDWNAYNENFNFTEANINYFQKRKEVHLPFLLLTHDYIFDDESYYNDYGPLKDQVEAFFDWLGSQEIYTVWITEYYEFFQDTFMATISKNNTTFTVTRPKAKANFVKIFIGNNQKYAVGTSVLTQKISDGWLYVTLKPETTSTFILSDAVPIVDFTASPTTGLKPLTVSFTDLSVSYDGITSWNWNFGDGEASTEENPTHTYASAGLYTVSLTVLEEDGDNDTETRFAYIIVDDSIPTASFTYSPSNPLEGYQVAFDASDSTGYNQPLSYSWDFGDDSFGEGVSPANTYVQDGDYLVTLTVTDSDETTDSISQTITVADTALVADFSATPTSGLEPLTVTFTDQSVSYDGIINWTWNFGDGETSTEQNPIHKFPNTGTFNVMLTVTDADGPTDTITKQVSVLDMTPPIVDVESYTTVVTGVPVNFDASGSSDNVGIVSYKWDFGDGTVENSTISSVIHTYANPRVYMVILTVMDEAGNMNTSTISVIVNRDTDGDLIPDYIDTDDDNDEISDDWEILHGLNPLDYSDASIDFDGDGLSNLEEYEKGTNPNISDARVFTLLVLGMAAVVVIGHRVATTFLWRKQKQEPKW